MRWDSALAARCDKLTFIKGVQYPKIFQKIDFEFFSPYYSPIHYLSNDVSLFILAYQ